MRKYIPNNKETRKAMTRKETILGKKCDHSISNKLMCLILDIITEKQHNRNSLITILKAYKWSMVTISNIMHKMKVEKYFSYDEDDNIIFSNNHHCTNGVWFVG